MTDKLPSMPFFVSDYLASTDVLLMSLAERGLYTHLLFRQWQDGRLQFNPEKLSILCACSESEFLEIWEGIKHKFITDSDGRIFNRRAETVQKGYLSIRKSRSQAGSKGGSKRQANIQANPKQNFNLQSSPIQSSQVQSIPVCKRTPKRGGVRARERSVTQRPGSLEHLRRLDETSCRD